MGNLCNVIFEAVNWTGLIVKKDLSYIMILLVVMHVCIFIFAFPFLDITIVTR